MKTDQDEDEDKEMLAVALRNAQSILQARQRAEVELLKTKEALEEETRILELLNRTGATLASNLDHQSLVQGITDAATELSGAQFGAFFYKVRDTLGESFMLHTLSGASREAFAKFGQPRATAIFAPTFRGEGVIRIADVLADERYGKMDPHRGMPEGHLPVRSYLAVPVTSRSGEVIGGLFFGHPETNVFSERAERLIVGVAAQAAIAIDNARLFEEVKRSAEERARLLELERASRTEIERISLMKDEFLATLSHELRTPLSAVLGWAQVLLSRIPETSGLRHGLQAIVRNARSQAQLIEDLLDMNRIVSGKIRLDVQRCELHQIVLAALDSVRPSAEGKAIELRSHIEPNVGLVFGDPNRLQQIVWNLLSNAVKFTPKGGTIEVTVRREGTQVEISVRDTGIGVSPEFLPHLFERFRQADSSTTRRHGGLGLGLSIVKQLVELHGGSVRAESAGLGLGATLVVTVPVRSTSEITLPLREAPAVKKAPMIANAERSLAGVRVLVVDDEPDARTLVATVLGHAAAEVITAESVDAALELVKAQHPDVIVSDIGMPVRDGYDFMREVRALEAASDGSIPAIALTAFARQEDRLRAMQAGYQVHLTKPIEPHELVATIRSLVREGTDRSR